MQKINPPCSHAPCPCVRISLSLLHTLYSNSCSFSMLSEICRVSFFFSENWLLQLLSEIWLLVKLLSELWRPAGELSWARSSCGNPPFGVVTTLISALWQLQKNRHCVCSASWQRCVFSVVTLPHLELILVIHPSTPTHFLEKSVYPLVRLVIRVSCSTLVVVGSFNHSSFYLRR